jgi:hypothetical protein
MTVVHTAGYSDLVTIARAAARMRGPLALVLRFDHFDDPYAVNALRRAVDACSRAHVGLATDSEDLAADFERITGARFHLARPPVAVITPARLSPASSDGPVFGAFGGARRNKGFHRLPAIIDAVSAAAPTARFLIQAYAHPADQPSEDVSSARRALAARPRVTLIDSVMSPDAYADALTRCDALLLPYDPHAYRRVTSGVFVEGMAAGKAALIPSAGWMAAEAERGSLSRAAHVDFDDAGSIMAGVRRALSAIAAPCPATAAWAIQHSFDALLSAILASAAAAADAGARTTPPEDKEVSG